MDHSFICGSAIVLKTDMVRHSSALLALNFACRTSSFWVFIVTVWIAIGSGSTSVSLLPRQNVLLRLCEIEKSGSSEI